MKRRQFMALLSRAVRAGFARHFSHTAHLL
jgi:hypothetical protein